MFLDNLSEEQKNLFIDLAVIAMEANGAVDDSETALLEKYCREMAIKYRDKVQNNDCDKILERLRAISDDATLKKITIEIITLLYIDNNLADEEDELLNKIQEKFQFSTHLMGELIFVTKHLMLSMSLAQGIICRY